MKPAPFGLFVTDDGQPRPENVERLRKVNERLESIPVTAATFRPWVPTGKDGYQGAKYQPAPFVRDREKQIYRLSADEAATLRFAGAWPEPEWVSSSKAYTRWVNPYYVHAARYSCIRIRCHCGEIVGRYQDSETDTYRQQGHTDDCSTWYRTLTRQRLMERRCREVLWASHRLHSSEMAAGKLGMDRKSVPGLARRHGLNWGGLREVGRLRHGATFHVLNDGGFSYSDLAEAFAMSKGQVSRCLSKYRDVHPSLSRGTSGEPVDRSYLNGCSPYST